MKKALIIALLFAILSMQNAFSVNQRVYSVDSLEYETISDMYLATGHALPSSTGPWSEAELRLMLDQLDESRLPEELAEDYGWLRSQLYSELNVQTGPITLGFSADVALELYLHTNTDGATREDINGVTEKAFVGRENWAYDLNHADPFLSLALEVDVVDSIYIYFAVPLKTGFHLGTGYENEIGSTYVSNNTPFFQNMKFYFVPDSNFPDRAFISFGSDFWNVQLGRDRLSWGHGRTGNMMISDNMPYQDMMKFSAFSRKFKFTFLVSTFRHESNFYDPTYTGSKTSGDDKKEFTGISLYLAHRLEGRFFNDKLAVTLSEAIMYASETGTLDFRIFNPVYLFHNLYIAANSNSIMSLEVDYTPINGLNFYVQALLDDFAIPGGEEVASATTKGYPNALGYLAGATYLMPAGDGMLSFNLEGAYVDPYTYLRYKSSPGNTASETYGLDYVVSNRTYVFASGSKDGVVYDEYFLGYRYGNDCIVANLNVEWKRNRAFSVSGNAFFMAHGTHDKWTRWDQVGGNGDQWSQTGVTPTSDHETGNYRYKEDEVQARDAVCYTMDLGAYCHYYFTDDLLAFLQADYIAVWNQYNYSGNGRDSDMQFVIGARYSI